MLASTKGFIPCELFIYLGREDIFKPTIGNENLHEIINGNGVTVANFATSKNLTVKSTTFSDCNIHKFI
jgi:hypothetical protein